MVRSYLLHTIYKSPCVFPFAGESVVRRDVMTNRVTWSGWRRGDVSARLYRVKNAPRELLFVSLYTVYISTFIYIDFLIDLCPLSVPPVHFLQFFLTEKPVQTKNREIKKDFTRTTTHLYYSGSTTSLYS